MDEVFDMLLNVKDHFFLVFHSEDGRAVSCATQTVLMQLRARHQWVYSSCSLSGVCFYLVPVGCIT